MDEAILQASLSVLRERGWMGYTIEEVASRAGASKASVYRRYPSRIALVFDTAVTDRDSRFPDIDTGTIWGDLLAFSLGTLRMLVDSVWHLVLPGLLAEAAADPAVAEAVRRYWTWRREAVAAILERGVARGEVRPDADPESVLQMIDGPMFVRLLVTGLPLNARFADELVEEVWCCIKAPGRSLIPEPR